MGPPAATLMTAAARLPELWFLDGGYRKRLPQWAQWMVQLGQLAARPPEPSRRAIAAIAVPCRAYAAALIATGCVVLRDPLRFDTDEPEPYELAVHFENLCALRPGTTVTVAGRMKRVARFIGVVDQRGERYVVIEEDAGTKRACVDYFPLRSAHFIAAKGIGLSCLIVGQVSILEKEITDGDVVTPVGQPLQDLLRARRFLGRRPTDVRCDVAAATADLPAELTDVQPAVVIFDGAESFRKWREKWRTPAWVVVLDRTSPQFGEGVALVEDEFVQRRVGEDDPFADLEIPLGIEVMSFWGRVA